MQIRSCDPDDHAGVDALLKAAFPSPAEARLVVMLRAADQDTLELVAEDHDVVVGTVFFSPVTAIGPNGEETYGIGLAPVAVTPEHQKRGIGTALIESGLDYLRTLGVPWCVVLGDPDYYKRFDFQPADAIGWSWSGDPEGEFAAAFQVRSLNGDMPKGPAVVHYHAAFDAV